MSNRHSNAADISTYRNGNQVLEPYLRVFDTGGSLRLAAADELENGIAVARTLPNRNCSVLQLQVGKKVTLVADDFIAANDDVFAGTDGRVASSGSRRIGKSITSSTSAGDHLTVVIEPAAGTIIGGSGSTHRDRHHAIGVPTVHTSPITAPSGVIGDTLSEHFVDGTVTWLISSTPNTYTKNGTTLFTAAVPQVEDDLDFYQLSPQQVWTINHNRGKSPDDISVFDLDNVKVYTTVTNPTLNLTVISFSTPRAGRANLEFQ